MNIFEDSADSFLLDTSAKDYLLKLQKILRCLESSDVQEARISMIIEYLINIKRRCH